jgi:hypothetical protein
MPTKSIQLSNFFSGAGGGKLGPAEGRGRKRGEWGEAKKRQDHLIRER